MQAVAHSFGLPWLAAIIALALHVADEAANDFLSWFNPQALRIRKFLGDLPFPPTFTFWPWLGGLIAAVVILAVLTPNAYAASGWLRPVAIIIGIEHVGNGLLHLVASIVKQRLVPGVWTAPLMLVTGVLLLTIVLR